MMTAGTTLTPGMNIARSTTTSRTTLEGQPKAWDNPPQTPKIQRSLLDRLMLILKPRSSVPKFYVQPMLSSTAPLVKRSATRRPPRYQV